MDDKLMAYIIKEIWISRGGDASSGNEWLLKKYGCGGWVSDVSSGDR